MTDDLVTRLRAAGLKFWPGGACAPEDWDGGPVARRRSNVRQGVSLGPVGHPDWWRRHEGRGGNRHLSDIIGYRPTSFAPETADKIEQQAAEINRLRTENEALREALEPFAREARGIIGSAQDDEAITTLDFDTAMELTIGDFRRAARAYSGGGR